MQRLAKYQQQAADAAAAREGHNFLPAIQSSFFWLKINFGIKSNASPLRDIFALFSGMPESRVGDVFEEEERGGGGGDNKSFLPPLLLLLRPLKERRSLLPECLRKPNRATKSLEV